MNYQSIDESARLAAYTGAESDTVAAAYRYHRRATVKRLADASAAGRVLQPSTVGTATVDLARARADKAEGKRRYGAGLGDRAGLNADFKTGSTLTRWIENPEAAGLRFVGFADEIAKRADCRRSIDHTGWYTDSDGCGELNRGAVYQLPSRAGRPLYVVGYRTGSESRKSGGWIDQGESGAAVLAMYMRDMVEGERGGSETTGDRELMEAARDADKIAETAAETEREYREADSLGQRYREESESVVESRRAALALISEIKRNRYLLGDSPMPEICGALRAQVSGLRRDMQRARDKMESILRDSYFHGDLKAAFNDAAGAKVIA